MVPREDINALHALSAAARHDRAFASSTEFLPPSALAPSAAAPSRPWGPELRHNRKEVTIVISNTPDSHDERPQAAERPRAEAAGTPGGPEEEVWYHGIGSGPEGRAVAVEDADGNPSGVLRHVVRHSPSGMSWGYQGSGPADTARSLLIAALGEDAKCGSCAGTGHVVYHRESDEESAYDPRRAPEEYAASGLQVSRCWQADCDGGYRHLPYQDFKREHVAKWDREWRMSRGEIRAWLRAYQEKQARSAPDWLTSHDGREPEAGE